jgi:hypothetical protein
LSIPIWIILCIAPWIIMIGLSLTKDGRDMGSIINLSDRACYIGCGSVICLFLSLLISLVYWFCRAQGWW